MERNLLYNEIENVLTNGLSARHVQNELDSTELKDVGTIHYLDLKAGELKFPNSGFFIPDYFKPQENNVDIILYFHGLIVGPCDGKRDGYEKLGMKSYLENNKDFGEICTGMSKTKKNVIFISIKWMKYYQEFNSDTKKWKTQLIRSSISQVNFNNLMDDCLGSIKSLVQSSQPSSSDLKIGTIILAGHSAGGAPVQKIIVGVDTKIDQQYLSKIKECWGFDSQYNSSKNEWVAWLENHAERIYKHFSVGEPSRKGADVAKFKAGHPKSTVPPYIHISNLWKSLIKNKYVDSKSYYFVNGKTNHCSMVNKFFKECVEASKNISVI